MVISSLPVVKIVRLTCSLIGLDVVEVGAQHGKRRAHAQHGNDKHQLPAENCSVNRIRTSNILRSKPLRSKIRMSKSI